jgi:hypothetical protein
MHCKCVFLYGIQTGCSQYLLYDRIVHDLLLFWSKSRFLYKKKLFLNTFEHIRLLERMQRTFHSAIYIYEVQY